MMFYDLMFSDKKLYNTFIFGIENENYKMVSDNVIEVIKPYNQLAWMSGNQFNAYVTTNQSPTVWEDTIKKNEEAEVYRSLGFAFDETSVKNEFAVCKAINLTIPKAHYEVCDAALSAAHYYQCKKIWEDH